MTEFEDPVDTIIRLLDNQLNLTFDDGSAMALLVTRKTCDRRQFTTYDGQISVSEIEPSTLRPLNLEQSVAQRLAALQIIACAVQKTKEDGDRIRHKLREDIVRVLREYRFRPHLTSWTFANITQATDKHTALEQDAAAQPDPDDGSFTELSDANYGKVGASDDDRFQQTTSENTKFPFSLLKFKFATPKESQVSGIGIAVEGYGVIPGGNGFKLSIWNHVASAWQQAQTHAEASDDTLTITITSGMTNYIEVAADGYSYIYVLVQTTQASDGVDPAATHIDYALCQLTVDAITHIRTPAYTDLDEGRGKECFFKTIFRTVAWLIQTVAAV